jgi:hypothetical protein
VVAALDHKAVVEVEQIAEKTFRLKCRDCDWMETGGSQAVATRKKNKHVADHAAATHGPPEIPTIMDAIEGADQVPEVEEIPTPVRDLDYFRKLKEEAQAFNAKHAGEPEPPCDWDCKIDHSHSHPAFRDPDPDDAEPPEHWNFPPRGFELPRTRVDLTKARLELQAGPSDHDREAWMQARAESVSATAVAKLGMASDIDFTIRELVQEKVHGSAFTGNSYTAWGKEREPHLEEVGNRLHGLVGESRLFFARGNRRHSASPDGVGIHPETGEVALGEYKTCGKELTLAEAAKKGYIDQMQWQMYVMEASHCWLIWEWRRDDGRGGYTAVPGGRHLVMRDDARIEVLKGLADRYLAALDAYQVPAEPVDTYLRDLVQDVLSARAEVKACEESLRAYLEEEQIKSVELPEAKVSYTWGSARASLDRELLEKEHPGLLAQYTKTGKAPEKPTLRITPRGEEG